MRLLRPLFASFFTVSPNAPPQKQKNKKQTRSKGICLQAWKVKYQGRGYAVGRPVLNLISLRQFAESCRDLSLFSGQTIYRLCSRGCLRMVTKTREDITGRGSTPMAPPVLVYFRWDWDVHWGYDLGFDP